jgi:hypothetical protein
MCCLYAVVAASSRKRPARSWPNFRQPPLVRAAHLIKTGAHALSALGTAAAKRRAAGNRQIAGASLSVLGRCGNAQQLGHVSTTAFRAVGDVVGGSDQGLEKMIARLALVFIKWHDCNGSSVAGAKGTCIMSTKAQPAVRARLFGLFWKAVQGLSMPRASDQVFRASRLESKKQE